MIVELEESFISINEELPGWDKFVVKTKEIFPTIPKDWDLEIIHPPFATNFSTIYDRQNYLKLTPQ